MTPKSISIVVPAYNEEKNIQSTVGIIHAFFRENFSDFEIIVVDDGSTDRTAAILDSLSGMPLKVVRHSVNQGKGYSVGQGVAVAEKEHTLLCDADLSTPLEEIKKLLPFMDEGFDIAIGSRAMKGPRLLVRQGFLRRSMGKIFNLFVRLLLFSGIQDTQCGFKCFRTDAAKKIFACQRIQRFSFDVEILYIAKRRNLKIKEVPVAWVNRPDSRVVVWRDPWNMWFDLWRIRMNAARGLYEKHS